MKDEYRIDRYPLPMHYNPDFESYSIDDCHTSFENIWNEALEQWRRHGIHVLSPAYAKDLLAAREDKRFLVPDVNEDEIDESTSLMAEIATILAFFDIGKTNFDTKEQIKEEVRRMVDETGAIYPEQWLSILGEDEAECLAIVLKEGGFDGWVSTSKVKDLPFERLANDDYLEEKVEAGAKLRATKAAFLSEGLEEPDYITSEDY